MQPKYDFAPFKDESGNLRLPKWDGKADIAELVIAYLRVLFGRFLICVQVSSSL